MGEATAEMVRQQLLDTISARLKAGTSPSDLKDLAEAYSAIVQLDLALKLV